MDIFHIQKRYKRIKKQNLRFVFLFYKSEKSSGRVSIVVSLEFISISVEELFHKTLSHNHLICWKILSGLEYLDTSRPKSHASLGNMYKDKTITINQIIAYLIELIAGFILSSFPPESISNNPHRNIYQIENIQAKKTSKEIDKSIKSPNSILDVKSGVVVTAAALAISININFY